MTYVLPRQAVQVTSSGVMVSMAGAPVRLECPFTYTKFLCGAAAPASGAATGFQNLSVACIDTLLECDGVPNCLNAEDERSCLPPPSSQLAQRTAAGTTTLLNAH